jgi:hypothetical protein
MGRSEIGQAEGTCCRHIKEQFPVMKHVCKILRNDIRGKTNPVWSNRNSKGVQPGGETAFQIATDFVKSSLSPNQEHCHLNSLSKHGQVLPAFFSCIKNVLKSTL